MANKDAQTGDTENEDNTMNEINILVAYFSATNTTEGVAEHIANGLGADLYEIVPEEAYTDADLNYNDDSSRSTIEMNDPSSRPAISGGVENMEQYDIVFIGYPIWWGEAPRIVSTFMESYDFSGKTLIPFCTSGGSGLGSSASNLAELTAKPSPFTHSITSSWELPPPSLWPERSVLCRPRKGLPPRLPSRKDTI